MTRDEFIEKIKGLGFNVCYNLGEIIVEDKNEFVHAIISEKVPFMIDTDFPHYANNQWERVEGIINKDLFDIIVEYASTPLEERENKSYFVVVGKKMVYHSEKNGIVNFLISEKGFSDLNAIIFNDKSEAEEVRSRVGGELVDAERYLETECLDETQRWHFVGIKGETKLIIVDVFECE